MEKLLFPQVENRVRGVTMENKKIKWLIYTVLVGLIPIMSRLLVWLVSNKVGIEILNASDFVAFGLVLHISNINEIVSIRKRNTPDLLIYIA